VQGGFLAMHLSEVDMKASDAYLEIGAPNRIRIM
jgi:hypothetical protein